MSQRFTKTISFWIIGWLWLTGCQGDTTPTATSLAQQEATITPQPPATDTPRPTNTATPIPTPLPPTPIPQLPTDIPTSTVTPFPQVAAQVVGSDSGAAIMGAAVRLLSETTGYDAVRITNTDGRAVFGSPPAGDTPYTVLAWADGYVEATAEVMVRPGPNEVTIELEVAPTPTPTWTPAPTVAAPPPPPPAPAQLPTGVNLLINPGFENGGEGWREEVVGGWPGVHTYSTNDYPQFIHSGQGAATLAISSRYSDSFSYFQLVYGITPGVTYRFGAWGRFWSSLYEDRTVSVSPSNSFMYVCINTNGDTNIGLATNVCSGWGRPVDTWQYFSVDAVANADHIAVLLVLNYDATNAPNHNEALWDDAHLEVASVAATPSPTPVPLARPEPIPFEGVVLRDSMTHLQWTIEQIGGQLDRLYNGEPGSCSEFTGYYADVIRTTTYHSILPEWQNVYNEYIWAADHVVATNEVINSLCAHGGGALSAFNYGVARSGIYDSLARLIPAIATANALLGQ